MRTLQEEINEVSELPEYYVKNTNNIEVVPTHVAEKWIKQEVNQGKAEAVTHFIDTMVGALESGFVDKNSTHLSEIYHFATWHVKDNYGQVIPTLAEKWGEEVATECSPNKWTETPPSEQGYYWHWNGDKDSAPFMFSILKSGTNGECFIAGDQGGFKDAQWCNEYGGYWMKQQSPELPNN